MKKHNGMRPHDVVIILKIVAKGSVPWRILELANELGISQSEISESLNRSMIAALVDSNKRTLMRSALLEFLHHGMRYVFPQHPGAVVRGMPTAHSAAPLNTLIESNEQYVWPWAEGKSRGQRIEPLHKAVPEACTRDSKLYELLALCDALRIGKAREREFAIKALEQRIND